MMKVLVLCTGNSCRSIMAEALLNHYGAGRIEAVSAGSFPTGQVHPIALSTIRAAGHFKGGYSSKSWDVYTHVAQEVIITVCDDAAGESCPLFSGAFIKAHWGVPDPAKAQGNPEEIEAVFAEVYSLLERRVQALIALPFESMDKPTLSAHLQRIGKL